MRRAALSLVRLAAPPMLFLTLTACPPDMRPQAFPPPPIGSTEVFREALNAAPGAELIVADLRLEKNAVGEAHYHPWEEYLYVIEGSAILEIQGLEPRTLLGRQGFVIPARTVHTPRAGIWGVRAIVIRVHRQGDPVAVPAGQ
jgi:quercetin dioxygenase-like cupin family protein